MRPLTAACLESARVLSSGKMKSSLFGRVFRLLTLVVAMFLLGFSYPTAMAKPPKLRDIADTVAANPILTKFALLVQASDLGTFLSSRGPFTVFVPTDSAFSKLAPETLEALLRPENKVRLQDIVLYHVVNGQRLTSKDLLLLKTVISCEGSPGTPLTIKTSKLGTQFVMKAKIVHADIRCQNGIINEIDTVLMPSEATLPALAAPPPPPPASGTNAPPVNVTSDTNTPSAETNSEQVIPVAPIAAPENK